MTNNNLHSGTCCFLFVWLAILPGCTGSREDSQPVVHSNYIVMLDLSDRLLNREAVQADTAMINAVFNEFESTVKQHLFIRSKDRFVIRLAPQRQAGVDRNYYENLLSIDMSQVDPARKNARFREFSGTYRTTVAGLYSDAMHGRTRPSDFFGCDIWQYVNEQLGMDLKPGHHNIVIVLTDGYFDFEESQHALREGNRYTCSDFYYQLNGPGWKEKAESMNYGLIPVAISISFRCHVCGLSPKTDQLTELEKLSYFWTKWMEESGCDTTCLIPLTSTEKMKSHLFYQLNQ